MANEQQCEPKQLPPWALICPLRDRDSVKVAGITQELSNTTKALHLHNGARASLLARVVQLGICNV